MGGWIKVHRKILESDFYKNLTGRQRDVIITMLLMAEHEPRTWNYKGVEYHTEPGQIFTNLKKIQEKCGKDCTRNIVRATLTNAEQSGFITIKTNARWTLITIENWSLYQSKKDADKQTINDFQTNEKLTSTTNNKNIRKEEVKNIYSQNSEELRLSKLLLDEIRKNNPKFKEPNIKTWAGHIDKAMRIDGRSVKDLEDVIKYAQGSDFWKANILSTQKLRAKFDTLYMQLQNSKPKSKVLRFKGDDNGGDGRIQFY